MCQSRAAGGDIDPDQEGADRAWGNPYGWLLIGRRNSPQSDLCASLQAACAYNATTYIARLVHALSGAACIFDAYADQHVKLAL